MPAQHRQCCHCHEFLFSIYFSFMFTICSTVMEFSQSLDIIRYHSTLYDLGGLNGPNRFSNFHAVFWKFCIVSSSFRNLEAATAVCFCLDIYIIFLFLFNSFSSSVSSYLHSRISIIDEYIETSVLFGLNFLNTLSISSSLLWSHWMAIHFPPRASTCRKNLQI